MSKSYDGPEERFHFGVTDSVEDALFGREPTARELEQMNAVPEETAFERDRERYGEWGDKIIQVRIAGGGKRTYGYAVPFHLDVRPNDWVSLPGNVVNEDGGFGLVMSYGRDGYDGPLKEITGKIPEPSEWKIRMSVVKTKPNAAKIYEEAVSAGVTREELLELIKVGQARLKSKGIM